MKHIFTLSLLLFAHFSYAQIDIDTLSKARYGISSVVMGDTLIFAGGDNYDFAEIYDIENGVVDLQAYTPNDGFESAKVISNESIALFYDLTNVNLILRSFYKYDKEQNLWSDGKYNVSFNSDVIFLDGDLLYSFIDNDFDSTSVLNIKTNEGYKIESILPIRQFGIFQNEDFIICAGGYVENGDKSYAIYIYDKSTQEWSNHPLQLFWRESNLLLHENKIIISPDFWGSSKNIEIFDLTTLQSDIVVLPQSNSEALAIAAGQTLMIVGGDRNYALTINLSTLEVSEPHELEVIGFADLDLLGEALGNQIILGGERFPRFHIYDIDTESWSIIPMEATRRQASMLQHNDRVYFVGGRDTDNNRSNAITVFDIISSVSEEELLDINIFPNPTSDIVSIDYKGSKINDVSIFSQMGNLLKSSTKSRGIDISNFSAGVYFIKINVDNKKTVIKKLIIR